MSIQENLSPHPQKTGPILWIGDHCPTDSVKVDDQSIEIKTLGWNGSFADLLRHPYSLIIGEVTDKGQLDILENLRLAHPDTWVGVYFNQTSNELVRRALNSRELKFFVDGHNEQIEEDLRRHLNRQALQLQRSWLLREYYQRNKNLESLTSDLEKIVVERTLHLEQYNKDQTDKNQMERALIRLIKEMAGLSGVEDILKFLRKELRKFHKVGEPILCLQFGKNYEVYHFRNGQVQRTGLSQPFSFFKNADPSNSVTSSELANILARPFLKTSVHSLSLSLISQLNQSSAHGLLCFEHTMGPEELSHFDEYISERINPISISLDRILLEQELDIFSYRWEKTFEGIKDPIAIIDFKYQLLRSNRKFLFDGKKSVCHKAFGNSDSICPGCPLEKASRDGTAQSGEVRVNQKIYQVWSYPIKLRDGEKPTSFVNQYVDITESREIFIRMLQHEKMAAIGTLAGHIAHELNNPLTGIRSLSQVMLAESHEKQVQLDLAEIEKAAGRCQLIIKNLLEFTEEDKEGHTEIVNLDELVERTLPMLKTALRNHRIRLELNSRSQSIEGYPHLLQQVIFNLVNNACQAMKTAGEIRITTGLVPGDRVQLSISDTGPGISEEIKGRIFEPFFTTKSVGEGTGLGLNLSKKIVERCGGDILFTSKIGQGTNFILTFPVRLK